MTVSAQIRRVERRLMKMKPRRRTRILNLIYYFGMIGGRRRGCDEPTKPGGSEMDEVNWSDSRTWDSSARSAFRMFAIAYPHEAAEENWGEFVSFTRNYADNPNIPEEAIREMLANAGRKLDE